MSHIALSEGCIKALEGIGEMPREAPGKSVDTVQAGMGKEPKDSGRAPPDREPALPDREKGHGMDLGL